MFKNNHDVRSSPIVVFLILLFLSLTSTVAVVAVVASSSSGDNLASQSKYLRLPFFHKSSLLSSSSGTPFSSGCEGKTYFLRDEDADRCKVRDSSINKIISTIHRGGGFGVSSLIPAGYNPFGYQVTELGRKFLEFEGSLDSDVGRFMASVKTRKRFEAIKSQWLEILRVSKKGQCMRIYRNLEELIAFCLKAGFLD